MSRTGMPVINFINFNQTGTCISMGTSEGLKIFNCDPFGRFYSDEDGGCGIVEMLFSTSLLAVVGIGDNPSMSPRRLRILNTKRHSVICEVTFPTTILAVKMNRSRLVVLLQEQIYIYDINSMRLLYTIETSSNPRGLISMSPSLENNYLAYPSPPKVINSGIKSNANTNNIGISARSSIAEGGSEYLDKGTEPLTDSSKAGADLNSVKASTETTISPGKEHSAGSGLNATSSSGTVKNGDVIFFNLQTLQPTMVIEAHKGEIAALALSKDGTLLATASEKGTIIRVFSVETCTKVYQFRRGTYPTRIYSLNFSDDNEFLAASSSNKTVHIFKLGKPNAENSSAAATNSDDDEGEADSDDGADDDGVGDSDDTRSTVSIESFDNGSHQTREPIVDSSRKTVGRMIRKSSQNLSRKAAKALGSYFPKKVTSILEPRRHFASLKIPIESGSNLKTICTIGEPLTLDISDYPELFSGSRTMAQSASISANSSDSSLTRNSNFVKMIPIRVVSSEGYMYNYVLDPERGGDCLLLSQYPLLMD
ncbi:AAL119Wp [Eremothecium gossypii ATCC 10895]|uniref:Autophagy-related protein 18 n=1 Tax=Eremothecium gossypii (strain ATCC 10895 / CBS 109.51 / FGSC 9923 / NRRL Y-1056) TaxID=284811 RepID=ATG18_EREGS|nr:AAL119Wp [Eremothecium gossypii ATCC 10895]Q75F47.1 RecName: Full=Autophagy-related protein 18 [Eremothecium gossypii ATCC 10895]AAS50247.1 AAL119Wp [Eremothecium gossypii ATCC 10895]AEY94532.1 FAAL119Wp [Eremothecium gossypii FDAG1]